MTRSTPSRRSKGARPAPVPIRPWGPLEPRDWMMGGACAAVAGLAAWLAGRVRFVDRDEGFFAMAADLVRHGQWPWRDFLFPQGALFPFLLAPLGGDVMTLRWTSAAFTALLVFALASFLSRRCSPGAAALASLLLLTERESATWLPTLKTYAAAGGLSVAASVLVASAAGAARGRAVLAALAGGLLGAAALIRVPCLALLVPLAAWLVVAVDRRGEGLRAAGLLVAVSAVTITAACLGVGASGEQILFNAILVHQRAIADPWSQRFAVIGQVISNPQTWVLVAAAVIALRRVRAARWNTPAHHPVLAAAIATLLTLGYWAIDLTYAQYFTFAAPFWIWAGAPVWQAVAEQVRRRRPWAMLGTALGIAGWLVCTVMPWRVGGPLAPYPHQRYFAIDQVQAVRASLTTLEPKGSTVASVWPGYVAGTGHVPMRGMESTISFETTQHLRARIPAGLPVATLPAFVGSIEAGEPAAVVINTEDMARYRVGAAGLQGYETARHTGDVVVLVKRPAATRP